MPLTFMITLSGCWNNCSYFDVLVIGWLPVSQNLIRMCDDVKTNYVYYFLESTTKKIQHGSKVNYVIIFFIEQGKTLGNAQRSLKFYE